MTGRNAASRDWDDFPEPSRRTRRRGKPGTQVKDLPPTRRTLLSARGLKGRLFLAGGELYLVRGTPDFGKLLERLCSLSRAPRPEEAPGPIELGFAAQDVSRVQAEDLAIHGHALKRWRRLVGVSADNRANRAVKRTMRDWSREISGLSGQLEQVRAALEDSARGAAPAWGPYVVAEETAREADALMRPTRADRVMPELWNWTARLVCWLDGLPALRRFMASVRPRIPDARQLQERRKIQDLVRLARAFLHRLGPAYSWPDDGTMAPHLAGTPCLDDEALRLLAEMNQTLEALSDSSLRARFPRPARRHDSATVATRVASSGQALLDGDLFETSPGTMACVAALTACTQGTAVFALDLFQGPPGAAQPCDDERRDFALSLHQLAGKSDLVPLVRVLSALREPWKCPGQELDAIWDLQAAGLPPAQLNRVHETFADSRHWYLRDLGSGSTLAKLLELALRLQPDPEPLHSGLLEPLFGAAARRNVDPTTEVLLRFLRKVPPRALNASLSRGLSLAFKLIPLVQGSPDFRQALETWAHPPLRLRMPGCPTHLGRCLPEVCAELAHYQQLSGVLVQFPAPLRRLVPNPEAQAREAAHLRELLASGRLTPEMEVRLARLEREREREPEWPTARLIRKAEELAALQALGALRHLAVALARSSWPDGLGAPPDSWLPRFCSPDVHLPRRTFEACLELETKEVADGAVAGPMLAMRNPCSESIRFLKDQAARSGCALLCLALTDPTRFRGLVTRRARPMLPEPVAALAILVAAGRSDGHEILKSESGAGNRPSSWLERISSLHDSYATLEPPRERLLQSFTDRELLVCRPLLVHALWRHFRASSEVEARAICRWWAAPDLWKKALGRPEEVWDKPLTGPLLAQLDALRAMPASLATGLERILAGTVASAGLLAQSDVLVLEDPARHPPREWLLSPRAELPVALAAEVLLDGGKPWAEALARLARQADSCVWSRSGQFTLPVEPPRARQLLEVLARDHAGVLEREDAWPVSELGRRVWSRERERAKRAR
ncbi:MAG: hypothetical protein HY814_09110 [Candidatus Riflebacteria bacterium]|nr:hypothetical protein [Candidatus Riflebacteria bacterium]